MKPGLYTVNTKYLNASFYVNEKGIIEFCAPILRKNFNYWKTIVVRIGD